ncbi:hypothetical protein D5S18_20880 [Nocardia panacis]|uniref:Uncharacterized protein n=1 Tax=Nocardia panacis TaxID=2340916 RepID=A0A3A4KGP4_9NOCA|nr:hypothetical protein [Nocardia panacis]RJO73639.1 hypothetical protein D5S18_20880 [Nocardia panacis]
MRLVKTGAFAVLLAGASVIGAGLAHANVDIELNGGTVACAMQANISAPQLTFERVGTRVTLSDSLVNELLGAGCDL